VCGFRCPPGQSVFADHSGHDEQKSKIVRVFIRRRVERRRRERREHRQEEDPEEQQDERPRGPLEAPASVHTAALRKRPLA
jgi:hypothetical protein